MTTKDELRERLSQLIDEFDERMRAHLRRIRRNIEEHPQPDITDNEEVCLLKKMVKEIGDIRAMLRSGAQPERLAA